MYDSTVNFVLDFSQFRQIKSKGFIADLQVLINQPKEHWGKESSLHACSRSLAGLNASISVNL